MKTKKKLFSILLALTLVFTMMPLVGSSNVYATSLPAITLGGDSAPFYGINGAQESSIYFGNYPQSSDGDGGFKNEPIKWRVLDAGEKNDYSSGNPMQYNGVFLLADKCLDNQQYNDTNQREVHWEDCTLRTWLNGSFLNTAFCDTEAAAVATTYVETHFNPMYGDSGGNDTEDKVFLLSVDEAMYSNYGFTYSYEKSPSRLAMTTDYARTENAWPDENGIGYWWLRTPGGHDDSGRRNRMVSCVGVDGHINCWGFFAHYYDFVVRPALNLNLDHTVLKSAAVDGKSSGEVGAGALTQVGENTTGEWKLTLSDPAHAGFDPSNNASFCSKKILNIDYGGAVKGDNEFISVIITDKKITDPTAKIKYYGRIKNIRTIDDTSGTLKVNVDGKMDFEGQDCLYLFNEQYNGDMKTDYSSSLKEITQFEESSEDHSLTEIPQEEVTCTEDGVTAHWTCPLCGLSFSDDLGMNEIAEGSWIIPAAGHVEAELPAKAPTCTEEGWTAEKYCAVCGTVFEIQKPIKAKGHKYGAWTKLNADQHQRVCQHDRSHIEKENHKWDGGKVTKAATKSATGIKTYTCTACKATKTEVIPKTEKKTNPLTVKGKTATIRYSKLKEKTQTLAVTKVITFTKDAKGGKTYTLSAAKKGKTSFKKYFMINKSTGKVTIKKNKKMKKGTYKVTVKVKAAGNANYKSSAVKAVTFKIKVK